MVAPARIGETAMTRCSCLAAALVSALAAVPQTALAQAPVAVGTLECRAGPATTFVVGSVRDFDCIFRSVNAPPQRYGATIQRIGLDLGWSNDAVLVWDAFAPT